MFHLFVKLHFVSQKFHCVSPMIFDWARDISNKRGGNISYGMSGLAPLISKIEKVPRDIRRAQSDKITTSSEKDWSQQVEHMQVPTGRDQVSGGVSVPCWHATPVADALWKPVSSDKVIVGTKSSQV